MKGLHVLLTGSAGGIGVTTARTFLEAGATVSLHYNSQNATLLELEQKYPSMCASFSVDCRKEKEVIRGINESIDKFGPINVIIVNHAIFSSEDIPIHEMSLEQWENTISINLTGVFLYIREFMRQLKKLTAESLKTFDASVILIGSTAGKFGEAYHLDYSACKSAMMYGMLKSLKNEIVHVCPRGRVNCVAPGWTYTPMAEQCMKDGAHIKALRTTPLHKIATTDDVASSILFLADSSKSGHLTGNTIMVDGGMEGRVLWPN